MLAQEFYNEKGLRALDVGYSIICFYRLPIVADYPDDTLEAEYVKIGVDDWRFMFLDKYLGSYSHSGASLLDHFNVVKLYKFHSLNELKPM